MVTYFNPFLFLFVCFFFFFFFLFFAPPPIYGSSQAGVKLELQLPAYTTTMATPDLSHICKLHCRLRHCWILNPLNVARERTHILMDTSCQPLSLHSGFFIPKRMYLKTLSDEKQNWLANKHSIPIINQVSCFWLHEPSVISNFCAFSTTCVV